MFVPLLLIIIFVASTFGAHHGATPLAISGASGIFIIIMILGDEIRFGALDFIADN